MYKRQVNASSKDALLTLSSVIYSLSLLSFSLATFTSSSRDIALSLFQLFCSSIFSSSLVFSFNLSFNLCISSSFLLDSSLETSKLFFSFSDSFFKEIISDSFFATSTFLAWISSLSFNILSSKSDTFFLKLLYSFKDSCNFCFLLSSNSPISSISLFLPRILVCLPCILPPVKAPPGDINSPDKVTIL